MDKVNFTPSFDETSKLRKKLATFEKLTAQLMAENLSLKEDLEDSGKDMDSKTTIKSNPSLILELREAIDTAMNEGLHNHQTFLSQRDTINSSFSLGSNGNASGLGLGSSIKEQLGSNNNNSNENGESTGRMISLMSGDEISLFHDDGGTRGYTLGDPSLRSVGIKPEDMTNSMNPRFIDGVFRICTGLNYRARTEGRKMRKAIKQAGDSSEYKSEYNPKLAKRRESLEESQNAEHVEQLSRGEGAELIKFGDVIQLQHVSSQLFLATHKTPAPLNPNCRRVSLKHGSLACNFRILPRFKVRSIGSLVYAGDQIQLQSIKFDHLRLGASPPSAHSQLIDNPLDAPIPSSVMIDASTMGGPKPLGSSSSSSIRNSETAISTSSTTRSSSSSSRSKSYGIKNSSITSNGTKNSGSYFTTENDIQRMKELRRVLRQPSILQHRSTSEVNASMDTYRCFSIGLYKRPTKKNHLLSGKYFRFFHSELNAFMQASADSDKGEILDAAGTSDDPLRVWREDHTPAHVPYLKNFSNNVGAAGSGARSSTDALLDIRMLSAKAIWCFENVDFTTCTEISFNQPLRIKHVPSGKFLSVDSSMINAFHNHRSSSFIDESEEDDETDMDSIGGGGGGGVTNSDNNITNPSSANLFGHSFDHSRSSHSSGSSMTGSIGSITSNQYGRGLASRMELQMDSSINNDSSNSSHGKRFRSCH
mmetsp:Transcript_2615/g.3205  ORF Transcript_2615/g.3205 Transcript_2615/m.3205 type:complete len:705 (+) Transcript_2615:139-2253(+)